MRKMFALIVIAFIAISSALTYFFVVDSRQDTMYSVEEAIPTIITHVQEVKLVEETDTEETEESEVIQSIDTDNISISLNQYGLELPISGATGYTSTDLNLYSNENRDAILMVMNAGTAFRIIDEVGDLWYVQVDNTMGYVEHLLCMINLPDVVPSIVYYNSNSDSSLYMSRGNELPNVTSKKLYDAYFFNERFGEDQYAMPVLYSTAKLVCSAQNLALQDGYTLVIYETFRPADTQAQVRDALKALIATNSDVREHTEGSLGLGWFISKSISNHQRGCAIDVTLADVTSARYDTCGNYTYLRISEYIELEMPTRIHELSDDSAIFSYPVNSKDKNAWKSAQPSTSMNEAATLLQFYCTESGMNPLASEWWHFNDLDTREAIGKRAGNGKYYITTVTSIIPE